MKTRQEIVDVMEDRQINNESRMSKEEEEKSISDFLDMIIKEHPEVWRNITDTLDCLTEDALKVVRGRNNGGNDEN